MCGIAGILLANPLPGAELAAGFRRRLAGMTASIAHRGPDGKGEWANEKQHIFLGHRRLSIIDLSEKAAQPMHYGGRYTIVHNGEIYNYSEIRFLLEQKGYSFQSRSDTEVILAAYAEWKENCLPRFDGMFAFAIWDEKEQQLFAARDRFGEKPFYYFQDDGHFIFGSEMKALWAAGVEKVMDEKMMLNYLALGHVQNSLDKEQTFFQQIYSLPPAHFLKCRMDDFPARIQPYWKLNKEIRVEMKAEEAIERFNELLDNSVKRRLRSDVSIGASLSGGIDSPSIASVMAGNRSLITKITGNGRIPAFSAVFPGFEKDESTKIDAVAERLGLESHKVIPDAAGLVRDFEKLCFHQEEPFQSSGIYAQYRVYETAKAHGVSILLDGQGADEILAGYPR